MAEGGLSSLPTFEEHLSRFPSSAETGLDSVVHDQHLVSLSTFIAEWRLLTPFLCLTPAEENAIITSLPPSPPPRQCIDALRKWREKMGQAATYRCLIKALRKAKRADLIESLTEIIASDPQPSTSVRIDTPGSLDFLDVLQLYGLYLKDRYLAKVVTESIQWPPASTEKIFNLAMIKSETIQRGRIDNEFIRLTITGSVDDILHSKVPIQLQEIFQGLGKQRRVVLIEGAPGSGKSTLSLDICLQWGKGKLFLEFKVVILVRLRDPLVQNARAIENLLPSRDEEMRKKTARAIRANDGTGVLWILDGWDELPAGLPHDSIIHDLVKRDTSLHKSSVIVTSRPVASGNLRHLASSRVEIVGFTPAQQREYFLECLDGDTTLLDKLLEAIKDNVIAGSCYLPLNAAIIVHLFLANDGSLPTTVQGMFTAIVQCCLSRYLQKAGRTQEESQFDLLTDMPQVLSEPFQGLCQIAFAGVMDNKITFTSGDLKALKVPESICQVGLLQAVSSIVSSGKTVYFCFLHLSLQELLSAVHISRMPASKQISIFQKLFGQSRFSAVFQFYAGITKLTTSRPLLSLLPRFLRPVPADILDIVQNICRSGSKPLLVSLLHCLYEAQDVSLCKFVADQLGGKLNLFDTTLSPLDTLSIGYFLSGVCVSTRGVFQVNLRGCSIDDQCCKFLVRGLRMCLTPDNTVTVQLQLDMNLADNKSLLVSFLHCLYEAQDLSLYKFVAIQLLGLNLNLTTISPLDSLSIGYFLSGVCVSTSGVFKVNLFNCSIDDQCCKFLVRGLRKCLTPDNTVTAQLDMDLGSNSISEDGACHIADVLHNTSVLVGLSLYENAVTGSGLKSISNAILNNTSLVELRLGRCSLEVTEENGPVLKQMIQRNTTLQHLGLYSNRGVSDTGAFFIAEGLKENTKLRTLDLSDCSISDKGAKSICMALRDNKTLATLDLSWNGDIKDRNSFIHLSQSRVTTLNIPGHLDRYGSTIQHTINETRMRSGLAAIKVTLSPQYSPLTIPWFDTQTL